MSKLFRTLAVLAVFGFFGVAAAKAGNPGPSQGKCWWQNDKNYLGGYPLPNGDWHIPGKTNTQCGTQQGKCWWQNDKNYLGGYPLPNGDWHIPGKTNTQCGKYKK
jgi:hypothetical protein